LLARHRHVRRLPLRRERSEKLLSMAVRVAYGRPAGGAADRTKPASSTERSAAPDSFPGWGSSAPGSVQRRIFFGAGFLGAKFLGAKFLGARFLRRELSRSVSFVPTPCSARWSLAPMSSALICLAPMSPAQGAARPGAGEGAAPRRPRLISTPVCRLVALLSEGE